jgi:NNP family nitrate/nitrite transporter-like MFS transporter
MPEFLLPLRSIGAIQLQHLGPLSSGTRAALGVELTMNNAAALYFKDEFGQSTESAAAIASIWLDEPLCPWIWVDTLMTRRTPKWNAWTYHCPNRFASFRGVLWSLPARVLWEAIAVMIVFSAFVQAAWGSTFCIVPMSTRRALDPLLVSLVPVETLVFVSSNRIRQLDYESAFVIMGATIMGSAALSIYQHQGTPRSFGEGHPDRK